MPPGYCFDRGRAQRKVQARNEASSVLSLRRWVNERSNVSWRKVKDPWVSWLAFDAEEMKKEIE